MQRLETLGFAVERADAFAWLVSAANLAGIDVQAALEKHYAAGCPKCGGIPCACPAAPGVTAPKGRKPRARHR